MKQALFVMIAWWIYSSASAQVNGFIENRGQLTDTEGQPVSEVLYTAESGNAVLYFMKDRIACVIKQEKSDPVQMIHSKAAVRKMVTSRFDIELNEGAELIATGQQPGYSNYYLAHCPQGILDVPSFSKIIYRNIYDNIDLHVIQNGDGLKLDFRLKEGADPSPVHISFLGEKSYRLGKDNMIEVTAATGNFYFKMDISFNNGSKAPLDHEKLSGSQENSPFFEPLTSTTWATYIGGSDAEEGPGLTLDAAGNAYLTGYAQSVDLPVGTGTVQDTLAGGYDAFVFKLDNATGNRIWATYYGGTGTDFGYKIKAWNNMPVMCGYGSSTNLPMTPGAWQSSAAGSYDGFIVRLNSNGTLNKTTYFGGPQGELLLAMDIDSAGNVFTGGATGSTTGFPITAGAFQSVHGGAMDAFCAKFDTSLALVWSTYYGGSGSEDMHAMTLDDSANVIFSGGTFSTDFPVSGNAFQSMTMGGGESYIVKMDAGGTRLWATYIGGYANDDINGLAADGQGNIYFAGFSESLDFPVTANAFQSSLAGASDVTLAKFLPGGAPVWISFYGGSSYDYATSIAMDTSGNIFVGGYTGSSDFPVSSGAFQPTNAGSIDGFFLRFDTAQSFGWATYFGGGYDDYVYEIAVDDQWNVFLGGTTISLNLPDTAGVMQPVAGGNGDAFMTKMDGSYGLTIGIHEMESDQLKVYPNPAIDVLFIDLPYEYRGTVGLTDVAGRTITSVEASAMLKVSFDVSKLPQGIYFIRMSSRKAVARIIKM